MKELENRGDDLTREIIELLNTQYITPFDREDIYELAKAIDDVVDYIENASDLLGLYKVVSRMEQSSRAVPRARRRRRAPGQGAVRAPAAPAGGAAHRRGQERSRTRATGSCATRSPALFEGHATDPVEIIRWKDIFEALEDAIDSCETAADLVGNIVVKNV